MAPKTEKQEMLTATKIAQQLGVTPDDIKKTIASLKLKADQVKSGCSYFSPETVQKIQKALK